MKSHRYAAILLAAGYSRRMRAFKPLLTLGESTLIERTISIFIENDVDVYVVTGYRQQELRKHLIDRRITIVENPEYDKGMFSSIQSGVRNLDNSYHAFFVLPVDISMVRPFTVRRLLTAAKNASGCIIYPAFNNRRGHPPLIPVSLIPEILGWRDTGGLQAVLDSHLHIVREVRVPDKYILQDMDTPGELKQMEEILGSYEIPDDNEIEVILSDIFKVSSKIRRHCQKVAEVALAIGQNLTLKGHSVNLSLIRAAALLHDIAKGQPEHERLAALWLQEMGFGRTAAVVAVHTNLPQDRSDLALEDKIVFLADKYVAEDEIVTLEERFEASISRFGLSSAAVLVINERREQALRVKKELEFLLGNYLESIF